MALGKMALKSNNVRKVVKQMLNAQLEHKVLSNATGVIDWTTAGVVSLISTDVAQGDDIGQRSGDLIRPKKLTFRIAIASNAGAAMISRIILFQDTMANGSTPAVTDILNSASNASAYKPTTFQEHRFKVLKDFVTTTNVLTQIEKREIVVVCPMRGVIHYVGSAAAAASAGKNSMYALFISDIAGTAGQKTYNWSYQLEYTDA